MTDDVKRTRAGQFAPGQSGNAAGARSRKPKPLLGLADLNRTILEIAASETTLTRGDRSQTVNMLERNAWVLASGKAIVSQRRISSIWSEVQGTILSAVTLMQSGKGKTGALPCERNLHRRPGRTSRR